MSVDFDSPLPSGTWTLYFHAPREKRWTLDTFQPIVKVSCVRDILTVFNELGDKLKRGMFFFMRRGFKPLWDAPENEAGGAWSKKIEAQFVHATWVDLMVNCVANEFLIHRKETLVGITISPKGPASIIKIWNTTTTVSDNSFINPNMLNFKIGDDVTYTAHKARPK